MESGFMASMITTNTQPSKNIQQNAENAEPIKDKSEIKKVSTIAPNANTRKLIMGCPGITFCKLSYAMHSTKVAKNIKI